MARATDLALDKGLPANIDAERFILGSLLIGACEFADIAGAIAAEDFALEKHRRIFARMTDLDGRGAPIDRVTLYNELLKRNEAESCDGLSYLVSLDDGLPHTSNVDGYVRIVRDKALLRRTVFACQSLIDRCLTAQDEPDEILQDAEAALARLSDSAESKVQLRTPREIIAEHPGGVNGFAAPHLQRSGIPSPWPSLNEVVPAFRDGQFIIIAARPGKGKSVAAAQIAHHAAARLHKGAALFSLEMGGADILTRILCDQASVDGFLHREGRIGRDDRLRFQSAMAEISKLENLWIDDTTGCTVQALRSAVRKLRGTRNVDLVIVDYLQLMQVSGRHNGRVEEVSAISRGLKLLARELKIPVIAISQLSRASIQDDEPPQLHHLRESGSLEQDADVVIMQHAKTKPDEKVVETQFLVRKQRGGPEGVRSLIFNKPFSRFEDPKGTAKEGLFDGDGE